MTADTTQTVARVTVTLDDVRNAIGDGSPHKTNSGKLREIIGRGSMATIQRHLEALRAEETAAAMPITPMDAPAVPIEAAQPMWTAAWTAAQVHVLAHAERLAAERDAARARADALAADVQSITEQHDALEQALAQERAAAAAGVQALEQAAEQAAAAAQATEQALKLALEQAQAQALKLAADLERERAAAAAAAALAEAGRDLMRQELGRLTDQVGELKAALYKRAEASQATN